MTDVVVHPHEALQEVLDGRLAGDDLARVEQHLASCLSCQRELEALRALQGSLRALPREPVEEVFRERLLAALDAEDEAGRASSTARLALRTRRWVLGGVGIAVAAALASLFLWPRAPAPHDLPAAAVADFRGVQEGRVPLTHTALGAAALEQRLAADGLRFRLRVLDLSMMGWQLVGGRVSALAGRAAGLFLYRNEEGQVVVCEMFEGRPQDLPPALERFAHAGIPFFLYVEGDVTAIFWPEGDVLCVLVSTLPREQVRALAIAKAMQPS